MLRNSIKPKKKKKKFQFLKTNSENKNLQRDVWNKVIVIWELLSLVPLGLTCSAKIC